MHAQIDILPAGPQDREAVATLYAEAGYGAPLGAGDTVIVAKAGAALVGVVRLCFEEGVTVLRGMQVRQAHRGQGIGVRLPGQGQGAGSSQPAGREAGFERVGRICPPYDALVPA